MRDGWDDWFGIWIWPISRVDRVERVGGGGGLDLTQRCGGAEVWGSLTQRRKEAEDAESIGKL